MNLTTPPPVEQLDPGYAADVKHDLVRKARQSRKRRTQSWTPILAAACACALITTGVFYLGHTGGGQPEPAGPTRPARPAKVSQVPAKASAIESTDLGPASDSEARAAARQCLTPQIDAHGNSPAWLDPVDVDTATIRSARWVKDPASPGGRHMVLSFESTISSMAFHCLNGLMTWWDGSGGFYNETEPVTGTWSPSYRGDGPEITAVVEYQFRAADEVDHVQLRIRGVNGASAWYSMRVADNMGYLVGELSGVPKDNTRLEVDARAFDKDGKQVWSKLYG
ncbi:hypothetical protein ACFCV3_14565 [Kribbella sp. NPDC056345]|uniref:hypothetical protein n=1 Tax=Kribbella sp. NPDC056345 TaxID=3345789 RepID=UPI0035DC71FA